MSNWWESSPVDGNTSDNAASKNWWDEHPKEEASQDSALTRGITQAKSAAKTAKALSIGDYETVAQLAAERDAYRKANPGTKEGNELMSAWDSGDGIAGGIKNVVGEIGKDWKEAPSTSSGINERSKGNAGPSCTELPERIWYCRGISTESFCVIYSWGVGCK